MFYGGLGRDRRRYQRLNVNFTAFYKIDGPMEKEREASTLDVSKGGISFMARQDIPEWSTLLLKLYLFKMDEQGLVSFADPIEVKGEVRSCVSCSDNEYRVGVCFKDLQKTHESEIDSTLESALKYYA